jgi:polysaccharide biosynthesis protein PslH
VKSLLLCSRPPWPLHGGDRIRTWHLAKALSALGDVSIVAARGQDEDPSAIEEALSFASSVRLPVLHRRTAALRAASALASPRALQQALYDSPAARLAVRGALEEGPDVVFAHLVRTVPWLPAKTPPVVVDVQDALSRQYAQGTGHGWRRAAMALERRRIGPAEGRAIHRANAVTFISSRDQEAVLPDPDRPVGILPAVVDLDAFAPDSTPPVPGLITFVGQLRTAANRDMAVHFARRVLPLVRSTRRDARFRIVGQGADRTVRRLARLPGVEVVGAVDDVAPELRRAWLTVCPQRFGSGVQNKVLQSLAVGTPAVVTPDVRDALGGVQGLDVGRLDRAFAVKVADLLNDPGRRQQLSVAGVRSVAERHSEAALEAALRDLLGELSIL